jgi:hypothetical protein
MRKALSLYRAILKEHRNRLPSQMRMLGDDYVRNEFKLHKNAKPDQVNMFFTAWNNYLETLRKQTDRFGRDLDEISKGALNDDQRKKLNDMKVESSHLVNTK